MADKATRERLKAQAAQARAERDAEKKATFAVQEAPAEERKPKAQAKRKCCESFKKTPHLPECPTLHVKPSPPRPRFGTPDHKDWKMNKIERLPDGASFSAVYDAALEQWSGMLTIKDGPIFDGWATGVFRLMNMLDGFYRKWLANQKKPEPVAELVEAK